MTTAFADLETMWHEHHDHLVRFARRYIDYDSVEDIVQDVFCSTLKTMLNGKTIEAPANYLFRNLRNRIIDHYRARDRRPMTIDLDSDTRYSEQSDDADWHDAAAVEVLIADAPTPHEQLEQALVVERVHHAIGGLPPRQVDAIHMRLAGYTHSEIAEVMQINEDAAKQINTRAFRALRERLQEAA